MIPIEVVFAKDTLGAGDTGYGLLLGSWGVGMVIGSVVFAALRRAPLPVLLFFSTVAVGAGYLGTGVAQTLAIACLASAVGGAGNGVQWVAVMSAVQELTVPTMQARVIGVLESIGSATPGYRIRPRRPDRDRSQPAGDIPRRPAPASSRPRRSRPPCSVRGGHWPRDEGSATRPEPGDAVGETMVELIPGGRSAASEGEVPTQPNPEVRR